MGQWVGRSDARCWCKILCLTGGDGRGLDRSAAPWAFPESSTTLRLSAKPAPVVESSSDSQDLRFDLKNHNFAIENYIFVVKCLFFSRRNMKFPSLSGIPCFYRLNSNFCDWNGKCSNVLFLWGRIEFPALIDWIAGSPKCISFSAQRTANSTQSLDVPSSWIIALM